MPPNKILVLKPEHLGDLVIFSGSLKWFRKLWPQADIKLAVRKFGIELYKNNPYGIECIDYGALDAQAQGANTLSFLPKFRGKPRLQRALAKAKRFFSKNEKAEKFDLVVSPVLSAYKDIHLVVSTLRAAEKIGIRGNHFLQSRKEDEAASRHYTRQWDAGGLALNHPEMDTNRRFIEFLGLGVADKDYVPEFWPALADQKWAENILAGLKRPVMLLAPAVNSGRHRKLLPAQWYCDALQPLKSDIGTLIMVGSAADVSLNETILAGLQNKIAGIAILNLAGKSSVLQLVELVRQSDCIVSQETAVAHMASALRKPVAGIVGGGHFGRFYPWKGYDNCLVVTNKLDCFGCDWNCPYDRMMCIQDIPPAQAANVIREMLAKLVIH